MEISDALPGADLVRQGLTDLANGVESVPALLVLIGAPRLRRRGLRSAHSRYNALILTVVSFERAAECVSE